MKMYYAFGIFLLVAVQTLQTSAKTCRNDGYKPGGDYPKCNCTDGYKGYDCSLKIRPCEGRPCQNSGKCTEHKDGTFSCKCTSHYDGLLCEKRVRPCDSHPCKNGGNCSDDGDKCFTCECTTNFTGSDCSERIKLCEIQPCENAGVCTKTILGRYKCICKRGYGGRFCERKDALFTSTILDGNVEYVYILEGYLGGKRDWRLCYRATRDGFRTKAFHTGCDGKGPTVTLVRADSPKPLKFTYIFGGYTDASWGGADGFKESKNSFLFTLRNVEGKPGKSPIAEAYTSKAIYSTANYGPSFGYSGIELYIADKANENTASQARFTYAYPPPTGLTSTSVIHSVHFTPDEIEVFY